MFQLMKCEIEKIKIKNYILSGLITVLMLCFFMFVAMDSAKQGMETPTMTYESIIKAITTFATDAFVIYGAVLVAKLIVEEYTNKTVLIIFSYPIKREALIRAKLLFINIFVTLGAFIGNIICISVVTIMDKKFDLLAGSFTGNDLLNSVLYTVISLVMTNIFIFLPYAIGIWKRSITMTILSAILAAFIVQIIMSQSTGFMEILAGLLIAGVIILLIARYMSLKYVKNLESL